MRKAAGGLALALVAGIAGYLFWAYPRLPAAMPLNTSSLVFFGSRETFVGIPAVVAALFFALFLAAAKAKPKAAWLATIALVVVLCFVHVRVQAVLDAFLPIPENVAVACAVAGVALLVAYILAYRRRPAPKRVKPF